MYYDPLQTELGTRPNLVGITFEFSHHIETRFDWGIIDLHLDVKQAVITDVVIFSDALNVELID